MLWAVVAMGCGYGAAVTHGGWRTGLTVVTVLAAGLSIWIGAFASIASLVGRAVRLHRAGRSLRALVPWWAWIAGSTALGALAGTGVYESGLANVVAVPVVAVAMGLTLTSRFTMTSGGRSLTWACCAIAGAAATCVGLTIFL